MSRAAYIALDTVGTIGLYFAVWAESWGWAAVIGVSLVQMTIAYHGRNGQ